jgi:hypothetical protein
VNECCLIFIPHVAVGSVAVGRLTNSEKNFYTAFFKITLHISIMLQNLKTVLSVVIKLS